MELFLSSEDRLRHLENNWLDLVYSHEVSLISRFEYSPVRFELLVQFFNPENPSSKCTILFPKVTSFIDVIHDSEVFEASLEYEQTEDPLDFLESRKDGITEYFLCTLVRESWWRTNEVPRIERT
jgi:hypothetical protein